MREVFGERGVAYQAATRAIKPTEEGSTPLASRVQGRDKSDTRILINSQTLSLHILIR
jgi:hypothetical protein